MSKDSLAQQADVMRPRHVGAPIKRTEDPRLLTGNGEYTADRKPDRALHIVIQEQTVNKRTIGFTASYLTATPCSEELGGKKADVELKGTLGTYSNAKGPGLAKDLAGMMDQDLQVLRR